MVGTYLSPFGQIVFVTSNGALTDMMFDDETVETSEDALIAFIRQQLDRYFHQDLKAFNLPIRWNRGTPFQHLVWDAMCQIPYGEILSYSTLAERIGHPKACRAVGQACKRNPIGIVVPCHRVIGKDGSMTGYSGKDHVDLKRKLLEFESYQPEKGKS
jgi:O-6-methylguanine DNA methyltransferase